MRFFSIILFVLIFLTFRMLSMALVSNYGPILILSDQIFGFFFVLFKGNWFLKFNNKWIYTFSVSVFYTIVCLLLRNFAMGGMSILMLPVAIFFAFNALEHKTFIKNGIKVSLVSLIGVYCILPNYFQFYTAYIDAPKTKTPQVFPNILFINNNKEPILFDKEKIIVLDFWTTSCGVCFEEFPLYSDLASKYENDNRIEFYAVNVPLKRDIFEKSVEMIQKHNYSFKSIYVSSEQEAKEKLNLYAYPEIMIIKNNTILYQGHPSYKKIVVIDNFDKIISNLLK